LLYDIPTELKAKGIFHTTKILIIYSGDDTMKKTTLLILLLVMISTIMIAGCTQVQTLPAPASTPAVTAVPTYVQNQQGVAIIKTVTATPTPTGQAYEIAAVAVKTNETVKVAVKTNESVVVAVKS
jgi:PhoPQ-activated pathogenicity-related protein